MRFIDRNDAARRLLPLVDVYRKHHGVVLGIPRGGIPIAYRIANYLEWDILPLLVKKISHPENSEYAIGAVGLKGAYIDPQHAELPRTHIHHEIQRQRTVLKKRQAHYHCKPCALEHRVVMIVDDGIATGLTMKYAIEVVRLERPRSIVIVTPVASMDAVRMLRPLVEDLIVLHTPHNLGAIGEWYDNFGEVTDDDVVKLLQGIEEHEHEPMGRALRYR